MKEDFKLVQIEIKEAVPKWKFGIEGMTVERWSEMTVTEKSAFWKSYDATNGNDIDLLDDGPLG